MQVNYTDQAVFLWLHPYQANLTIISILLIIGINKPFELFS